MNIYAEMYTRPSATIRRCVCVCVCVCVCLFVSLLRDMQTSSGATEPPLEWAPVALSLGIEQVAY